MTTLVTGASGFVGTVLLSRNSDFLGCDINVQSENVSKIDLRDKHALLEFCQHYGVTRIVHLAGAQYSGRIARRKRKLFFEEGNVLLADSIRYLTEQMAISHVVFLSTDMVYGIPKTELIDENHQTRPNGPYGSSKLKCESILSSIQDGTIVTIFRPRLIIGAGRSGTINQLQKWISTYLPVPIIGSGLNRYQFISVNDVAKAIEISLKEKIPGVFNLGSDFPPEVRSLIPSVLKQLHKQRIVVKLPARATKFFLNVLDLLSLSPLVPEQFMIADQNFVLDTLKFKKISGWVPENSDKDMLFEALNDLDRRKLQKKNA